MYHNFVLNPWFSNINRFEWFLMLPSTNKLFSEAWQCSSFPVLMRLKFLWKKTKQNKKTVHEQLVEQHQCLSPTALLSQNIIGYTVQFRVNHKSLWIGLHFSFQDYASGLVQNNSREISQQLWKTNRQTNKKSRPSINNQSHRLFFHCTKSRCHQANPPKLRCNLR